MSKNKNNYNRNVSPADLAEKATAMNEEAKIEETAAVDTAAETPVEQKVEDQAAAVEAPTAGETAEAPAEEKKEEPVVNETIKPKAVEPKKADTAVERLNVLLDKYAAAASAPHPTDATRAKFVLAFSDIAEYVLGAENFAVFNRFYDFFFKERNAILASEVALAGIHKMTDIRKRERVAAFFTVFFALVRTKRERRRFALSMRAIRMSLQNDKFCSWLQAKLNGDL